MRRLISLNWPNHHSTSSNRQRRSFVKWKRKPNKMFQSFTKSGENIYAVLGLSISAIASKISRISTVHIEPKDSPDSQLQIDSICSMRILNIPEVITSFSKIAKYLTLFSVAHEALLILEDEPGLLAPQALLVFELLSYCRDEILWFIRHSNRDAQNKKASEDNFKDAQISGEIERILKEHIESKDSPDYQLQIDSICSVRILSRTEDKCLFQN